MAEQLHTGKIQMSNFADRTIWTGDSHCYSSV